MRDVEPHTGGTLEETDDESAYAATCGDLLGALAEIVLAGHAVVLSSPLEPLVARARAALERLHAIERVGLDAYDTVAAVLDEVEFLLEQSGPSLGGWAQPLQGAREHLVTLHELDQWQRFYR
jgi:hypothetical protein